MRNAYADPRTRAPRRFRGRKRTTIAPMRAAMPKASGRTELLGEEAVDRGANDAGRLNKPESCGHHTSAIGWIGRFHQCCLIRDRVYRVAERSKQEGESYYQ